MFNAEIPSRAELPSTQKLVKSTIAAAAAAAVILVAVVLPAEYAVDPTGVGRALGLTQMGEIKKQLAIEAEVDRQKDRQQVLATPDRRSSIPSFLAGLIISPAAAHPGHDDGDEANQVTSDPAPSISQKPAASGAKTDDIVFALKPGEGVEYKLTMLKGGVVQFSWRVDGGKVNYDLHGSPQGGGKETSYKKGREVARDDGILTAAYDGTHGWFWRNRSPGDVTVTLKVSGAYTEIKKMN